MGNSARISSGVSGIRWAHYTRDVGRGWRHRSRGLRARRHARRPGPRSRVLSAGAQTGLHTAHRLGPLGIRRSSAQLTAHYQPEDLRGRLVIAVTNFPPRQIGPIRSEVLVLGVPDADGGVVLLAPTHEVPLGGRVF